MDPPVPHLCDYDHFIFLLHSRRSLNIGIPACVCVRHQPRLIKTNHTIPSCVCSDYLSRYNASQRAAVSQGSTTWTFTYSIVASCFLPSMSDGEKEFCLVCHTQLYFRLRLHHISGEILYFTLQNVCLTSTDSLIWWLGFKAKSSLLLK